MSQREQRVMVDRTIITTTGLVHLGFLKRVKT
jgi:hypothetical protein